MSFSTGIILVPQGAEYQAVCRGLNQVGTRPTVIPIPVGVEPLRQYLQQSPPPSTRVLLMGLCGSLSPNYTVGDLVLYQSCGYQGNLQSCNSAFTSELHSLFADNVSFVKSLTSDRLIWSAAEKRDLGAKSGADVVDMEGFAFLEYFNSLTPTVEVAILRVVSDDCHHDIPNLSSAISPDGALQPLPLAWGLIRQPLAATRLIRGSLRGLQALKKATNQITQI
ncbi:phosphorylase [Cronbergia sp. UHCC 0137]|uniref:5'-methylthioadenosine/S-adenosylhomocysteine nucleosidase family protein n=1 Tax=Cronbergia sp. UHCC 0137 TaxID=3110239 RepID=UPI002B1FEE36|nr:phosphorylase [Cronbergia sp. UHCC 0137]MEA5620562.1 phosphorylase [Cronbergia sp. UHCC 0137]